MEDWSWATSEESSEVSGADFMVVSFVERCLRLVFSVGFDSRRLVIWVSMLARSVGEALSEGSCDGVG